MDQNKIYDIVIIGAGPAGLTAGIYARRANLDIVVVEKQFPGGKVATTATVENYPGFEKIEGYQLAYNMYDQLVKLQAPFIFDEVIEIKLNGNYKEVILKNQILVAKAVIVATGTKNRKLNIPNELEYEQKGLVIVLFVMELYLKIKMFLLLGLETLLLKKQFICLAFVLRFI